MGRALIAKLTGALGDTATINGLCASFGAIYGEFLPDVVKSETGLDIVVAYAGCRSGPMGDLVTGLGGNHVLARGALRNWSPNFVLACGTGFVMALVEHMLGALPETIEASVPRPLSPIELDLAVMVFDRIANVLRSAVDAPGGFEPILEAPHNAEERQKASVDADDEFAAAALMTVTLGKTVSNIAIVVPQQVLLRTAIRAPRARISSPASDEWSEQLGEQVRRSQVTLEARIRLEQLTLDAISRLAVGDVIPFMDRGDVRVEVSANSKDLYICEFGRSGENYTVRVKDNVNSDDELLRHLMN
jgi:flagellar motor switch protein FliM